MVINLARRSLYPNASWEALRDADYSHASSAPIERAARRPELIASETLPPPL